MKKYLKPSADITKFEVEDVIMLSVEEDNVPDGDTDAGWGELN